MSYLHKPKNQVKENEEHSMVHVTEKYREKHQLTKTVTRIQEQTQDEKYND